MQQAKSIRIAVFAAGLLVALGCEPPPAPPEVEDTAVADVLLPPCAQAGELIALDVDGNPRVLTSGSKLPVVLGFQGFVFVRLALRSPALLPTTVKVRVVATVPGLVDVSTPFSTVKTQADGSAWITRDVAFFFNDVPFAELAGKPAEIGLAVDTKTCRMAASASVVLEDGGYMGADAALWGTLDGS
jgi:hypothetical protein